MATPVTPVGPNGEAITTSSGQAVTLASAAVASGAVASGAFASGSIAAGAIVDGANVVEGTTTGAKVITDANGTIQQYLRGLVSQWIARTQTFATTGYAARVQVTRPSDTTTYGAGDVVGVTGGGTACITFPSMGPAAGEILITSVRFQRNATAVIAGETSYTLHLFNIAQPAAQVDNAVFDIAAGDQASYLGSINLGTPVDIGSTLAIEQNGINKQVTLASTSLFGVLVTVGGYQPVSAAVHIVELHASAI